MKKFLFFVLLVFLSGCASNQRYYRTVVPPLNTELQKHIVRISIAREDGNASCTGVIVSSTGIIATAKHCVRESATYKVLTRTGWEPAGVLRTDLKNDLALMHIKGWDWQPMPLCESAVDIDAKVCAVGIVLYDNSIEWECGSVTSTGYWQIITTTNVRPGFSGGPLIDLDRRCLAGITYAYAPYRITDPRGFHVGLGALKELISKFE